MKNRCTNRPANDLCTKTDDFTRILCRLFTKSCHWFPLVINIYNPLDFGTAIHSRKYFLPGIGKVRNIRAECF